jgi:UV DNA damage endonuclease
MRIGYPCINRSLGVAPNRTFRLASYSPARLRETIALNLDALERTLQYNVAHGLLYFRIGSELIPFASHPVCDIDWREEFGARLRSIGRMVTRAGMRIAMHPDQFVVLNSPDSGIVARSVAELEYHCAVLDTMGLPAHAKVQLHVGGVYGDKGSALNRFADTCASLAPAVRKRLVIENDDRLFALADCLSLHERVGVPILFDTFHHECLNRGESLRAAFRGAARTWGRRDGPPLVDYSSQKPGARTGSHTESIDIRHFRATIRALDGFDFDIMLEIKDKEESALRALTVVRGLSRW